MTADLSLFESSPVLVTGGLGFIGSNVACRLADLGAKVLIVDALTPNCGGNIANIAGYEHLVKISNADLCKREGLDELVTGQRFIFNFAGRVSHLDSMTDPVRDMEANVLAPINLLEACRFHAPEAAIVYASTRQIYGRPQALPVDEDHPLHPVDVNGVNKMAGEAFHTLYNRVYGLRTVSLRMTNTFGPKMRIKDARQTFLGVWLRRALQDAPVEVWGGDQLRDLSYIDDAVDACLRAALAPGAEGNVYNIGGCPPISLLALAELLVGIAAAGRVERKPFPEDRKVIDIGDYYADDSKFRALTDWAPKISLEGALPLGFVFSGSS